MIEADKKHMEDGSDKFFKEIHPEIENQIADSKIPHPSYTSNVGYLRGYAECYERLIQRIDPDWDKIFKKMELLQRENQRLAKIVEEE